MRLPDHTWRAPLAMSAFACCAFGPSVSTMKRNGWRFEPLGARVAAKSIARERVRRHRLVAVAADGPGRREPLEQADGVGREGKGSLGRRSIRRIGCSCVGVRKIRAMVLERALRDGVLVLTMNRPEQRNALEPRTLPCDRPGVRRGRDRPRGAGDRAHRCGRQGVLCGHGPEGVRRRRARSVPATDRAPRCSSSAATRSRSWPR